MILRLIAAGCLVVAVLNLGFCWLKNRQGSPLSLGYCLLQLIPLAMGLLLLLKSPDWARRLADYFED